MSIIPQAVMNVCFLMVSILGFFTDSGVLSLLGVLAATGVSWRKGEAIFGIMGNMGGSFLFLKT
jgi:hypothetical protein